jgi:NAD-dependent SIR2 family protein deacetylase
MRREVEAVGADTLVLPDQFFAVIDLGELTKLKCSKCHMIIANLEPKIVVENEQEEKVLLCESCFKIVGGKIPTTTKPIIVGENKNVFIIKIALPF